jgi:nitrogen fixation/metabolism regulation signal transduction histidine kinase
MTRELELAGARAHKSARETEQQRAWLEAVLERLSAGVLGFDREARLRSANRAAESILGVALTKHLGASAAEIGKAHANLAAFAEPLARHLRDDARVARGNRARCAAGARTLMVRGAALPDHAGYVAVFDDLTVLNRAQRDAAWGEVARRLAHEVKNPLTPIQLAAERLRRRFLGRLSPDDGELIDRATQTIVSQVEALKTMVNAFGDYARPQPMLTQPIALNALVGEVLDLYENDQRLGLVRQLDVSEPREGRCGAPAPGVAQPHQERARSHRRDGQAAIVCRHARDRARRRAVGGTHRRRQWSRIAGGFRRALV